MNIADLRGIQSAMLHYAYALLSVVVFCTGCDSWKTHNRHFTAQHLGTRTHSLPMQPLGPYAVVEKSPLSAC